MWNIKVAVTADHIANACRKDSHHCMVADAIHDRLKWATFIQADTQSIRFNNRKQGKRYIYLTPPEAQRAIVLFDQGVKVKPFAFTLSQGFLRTKIMRARQRSTKRLTRNRRVERKTPSRHTPSMYREFGLRSLTR